MLCVKLQGRIQLDVGGIRFFTSQATLTAKRGFFRALCDGFAEVTRDCDGCIFIDRDGGAFRYVLLHLQNQAFDFSSVSKGDLELLKLDADFYELDELKDGLSEDLPDIPADASVPVVCPSCQRNGFDSQRCMSCGYQNGPSAVVTGYRRRHVSALASEPQTKHVQSPAVVTDFQRQLASIESAIDDVKAALMKKRAELLDEKGSFLRLQKKIMDVVCGEKIKLQLMTASVTFCTTIRTLTSKPNSFFAAKFRSTDRWKGDLHDDGSVFIERDDCAFRHTLNYLRGYPSPKYLSRAEMTALIADKEYYQLSDWDISNGLAGSKLLLDLPQDNVQVLLSWLPKGSTELLYCASRDGWTGAAFHNACDSAPKTIVICKSEDGFVFGGYASASWSNASSGRGYHQSVHKSAPASFLFEFCGSPAEIVQLMCTSASMALCCVPNEGPAFGGPDLQVMLQQRMCQLSMSYYTQNHNEDVGFGGFGFGSRQTRSIFSNGGSKRLIDVEVFSII
jgi:hypothetical protein